MKKQRTRKTSFRDKIFLISIGGFVALVGAVLLFLGIGSNVTHNNRVQNWNQTQVTVVGYHLYSNRAHRIWQFEYNGTTFRAIQSSRSMRNRDTMDSHQLRDFVVTIRPDTIFVNPVILTNPHLQPFIVVPRDPDRFITHSHMLFVSPYNIFDRQTRIAYTDDAFLNQIMRIPLNDAIILGDNRMAINIIIAGSIVFGVGLLIMLPMFIKRKSKSEGTISRSMVNSRFVEPTLNTQPQAPFSTHREVPPLQPVSEERRAQLLEERRAINEPPYNPGNCFVYLVSGSPNKIGLIKVIRERTGMTIGDAKAIVDNIPSLIISRISQADAERLASQLQDFGACVEIEGGKIQKEEPIKTEEPKEFISNICPNCTGRLTVHDTSNKCCPFCGTKWTR
ncbi:MAG: ribosomal protein L7/L12 [Firmicutes bacterium]|nr:ribosomal protein L7/L12 [Bacillota bacterium]